MTEPYSLTGLIAVNVLMQQEDFMWSEKSMSSVWVNWLKVGRRWKVMEEDCKLLLPAALVHTQHTLCAEELH